MDIITIVEHYQEEYADMPIEEFMEEYDLDGRMMMEKGVDWLANEELIDYVFYCGPAIGDGLVSDTIEITSYLKKICDELDILIDTDISENMHEFLVQTQVEADSCYLKLKNRIAEDFEITEEP